MTAHATASVFGSVETIFGRLDYHSNRVCEKRRVTWLPPGFCTVAELVGAFQPTHLSQQADDWRRWHRGMILLAHEVFPGMFAQRTVVFEDGSTLLFRKDDDGAYGYGYYGATLDWGYTS